MSSTACCCQRCKPAPARGGPPTHGPARRHPLGESRGGFWCFGGIVWGRGVGQGAGMRADEIVDVRSLRRWLESRPKETAHRDAVVIAYRGELRMLPFFVANRKRLPGKNGEMEDLPTVRSITVAGVFVEDPSDEGVVEAAEAATATATARATHAVSAATAKAGKAAAADTAVAAADYAFYMAYRDYGKKFWHSVAADARLLEAGGDCRAVALWPGAVPASFQRSETTF